MLAFRGQCKPSLTSIRSRIIRPVRTRRPRAQLSRILRICQTQTSFTLYCWYRYGLPLSGTYCQGVFSCHQLCVALQLPPCPRGHSCHKPVGPHASLVAFDIRLRGGAFMITVSRESSFYLGPAGGIWKLFLEHAVNIDIFFCIRVDVWPPLLRWYSGFSA